MCEHVFAHEQISLTVLRDNFLCGLGAEEFRHRFNAVIAACRFSRSERWLNAEHRNAALLEPAQKIAVIACDFDDPMLRSKSKPPNHHLAVTLRVLKPRVGVAREVDVD